MIEEMFSLNGKLDDLYGLAEKAGEVADRFREVGYLVDMTDSYNDLLKRTYEYSAKVKSWAAEGDLYGYERQLRYFHSCEMQGIKLFNQYIEYFRNLKTSDADKAEQAQKALKELDKRRIAVTREMASIEQSRQFAAGIADAVSGQVDGRQELCRILQAPRKHGLRSLLVDNAREGHNGNCAHVPGRLGVHHHLQGPGDGHVYRGNGPHKVVHRSHCDLDAS